MKRFSRGALSLATMSLGTALVLTTANVAVNVGVFAGDAVTSDVLPTFGHLGSTVSDPSIGIPDGEIAANVTVSQPETDLPLVGVPVESSTSDAAAEASGCYGRSNSPHTSNTETGYVHAEGRIDCGSIYVSRLYIEGLLTRDRWYGEEERDYDEYTKNGGYWVNLNERSSCNNTTWTWHLYNYHEVKKGGKTYYAYTGNTRRFTC